MHSQQKAEASSNGEDCSTSPRKRVGNHDGAQDDNDDDEQHHWTSAEITQDDQLDEIHEASIPEQEGIGSILDVEAGRKPSPAAARHLDLDDFANSPAADADDAADDDSGEDIEMRIALG